MENGSTIASHGSTKEHGAAQNGQPSVSSNGDGGETVASKAQRPVSHNSKATNSILARLNFLRTSIEDIRPTQEELSEGDAAVEESAADDGSALDGSDGSFIQKTAKPRRRTGSLRKTAILGTGRIKAEKRNSSRRASDTTTPTALGMDDGFVVSPSSTDTEIGPSAAVLALGRRQSHDISSDTSTSTSGTWPPVAPPLSLDLANSPRPSSDGQLGGLGSPVKSPTDLSNASTTDDDDGLSFSRPVGLNSELLSASPPHKPPASSSGSSSYFPSPEVPARRRSTKTPLSPLSALPMEYGSALDHSYSETEWWGWVVLIVTWLVFVVGMGSCLGVWSWAWDVDIKPYAPPELEDDPTLPIVGYYPALIILTAVMAWVWVVVAWVGMKYFKHAKIPGDD